MGDRYSPKIDVVFRKLFGSDENKDLLISLINSVVEPALRVVDVVIKNPYNFAAYVGSKPSILDVKAVDQDGVWYDIEMQIAGQTFYGRRAIYYVSKVYVDQMTEGMAFSELTKTIGIHLIDFDYFRDDRIVRQFVFKDGETNEPHEQLSYLQLYFVEMNKAKKSGGRLNTRLDRWVTFLNEAEDLDPSALPEALGADQDIVKAVAKLERMGFDPAERELYDAEVKATMVGAAELEYAKQSGLEEGLERGEQTGREKLILRLIARRLGAVPAGLPRQLDRLSADQLDELGEALLDFTIYADVDAWLAAHP